MLRSSTFALVMMAAAGSAFAAGPEPAQPDPVVIAPEPEPFWEGPYLGAQLGYSFAEFDIGFSDFDNDNIIGGLTAGYLWALNNGWYIGPEFQYDWADITITDPNTLNSASFDEIARLKLIVGKEVWNGLLYGSAGLAYGSVSDIQDIIDGSDNSYVFGVGYDWQVSDDWSLGVEYLYHDFDGIGNAAGDVVVNAVYVKGAYRF